MEHRFGLIAALVTGRDAVTAGPCAGRAQGEVASSPRGGLHVSPPGHRHLGPLERDPELEAERRAEVAILGAAWPQLVVDVASEERAELPSLTQGGQHGK